MHYFIQDRRSNYSEIEPSLPAEKLRHISMTIALYHFSEHLSFKICSEKRRAVIF